MQKFARRAVAIVVLAAACAGAALTTGAVTHSTAGASAAGPCQLGNKDGQIKHVIYLQFDNTHYRRDRANVPSDLEQMPHLLNFLKGNGTPRHERPHDPDLAHGGRHRVSLTGPLSGSQRPDGHQLVRLLQADRASRSSRRRSSTGRTRSTAQRDAAEHGRRRRPDGTPRRGSPTPLPAATSAACRRRTSSWRTTHPGVRRHDTRLRRGLTRVERGEHGPATKSLALTDFIGIAVHCAQSARSVDTPNAKPDDATTVPGSDERLHRRSSGRSTVNPAINNGQGCVVRPHRSATARTSPTRPATAACRRVRRARARPRTAPRCRSRRCRRTACR